MASYEVNSINNAGLQDGVQYVMVSLTEVNDTTTGVAPQMYSSNSINLRMASADAEGLYYPGKRFAMTLKAVATPAPTTTTP